MSRWTPAEAAARRLVAQRIAHARRWHRSVADELTEAATTWAVFCTQDILNGDAGGVRVWSLAYQYATDLCTKLTKAAER